MPDLNRLVAGMRCREVLALLADYMDGELSPDTRERLETHVRQCEQCEKFGGEYSELVATLRSHQRYATDPDELGRRLKSRIDRVWQSNG